MDAVSQIANQAIPEGYKQTDVGVIPEDWMVKKISEAFEICNNLRLPLSTQVREKMAGDYPYYGPTKIQDYINEFRVEGEYALIGEDGDHFLKFDTTPQTQLTKGKFNVNNHAHIVKGKVATTEWFYLYFKHREIISHLSRQGAGRYKLNKATLEQLPCAIPPFKEQTAIANALSDVDALLSELEKLIAKKQAIKTATMQQLLTGKTRLPQFATYTEDMPEGKKKGQPKGMKASDLGEIPEDWEVVTLDDAADFLDGQRRPIKSGDRAKIKGQYPYYGASGIVDYVNDFIFDGEFILLGEDGENILSRNLPLAFKAKGKIWVNNHAHVMTTKENFHIDFLIPYLESLDYSLLNSGTAQPKLNKQSCLSLKVIKLPLEEQAAIASILSDMDAEIQALQQRLSKTRQIKQGMMQELLTGRTRLPY